MSDMSDAVRGRCYCGRVDFRLTTEALWCAHCHCTQCQRAHGAGVVTWVGYPETSLVFESDAGNLSWFASSVEAERGFCNCCGTTLFFRSSRHPGEIHIVLANLKGETAMPQGHVHFENRVGWLPVSDDLPKIQGSTES